MSLFLKKIPLSDMGKEQYFDFENIQDLHDATVKHYKEQNLN